MLSSSNPVPDVLLNNLKSAHSNVRDCIREMDALTSGEAVNRVKLTDARFRISKASLGRRIAFNAACTSLRAEGSKHINTTVDALRRRDMEMSRSSTAYVAHWTTERIESDWPGYVAASRVIRAGMTQQLAAEESFLFPLLTPSPRPDPDDSGVRCE